MKFLKYYTYLLAVFLFVSGPAAFVFAAGTLTTCPGVTRTLTWSSTGAVPPCGGSGGPGCNFTPSTGGSISVTLNSGSCTAIYNCTNSYGAWGTPDSATLTVANSVFCCGTGSQSSTDAWNGTTCVVSPMTNTEAGCYLARYKDLRDAGLTTVFQAKSHYAQYGAGEGRSYSCCTANSGQACTSSANSCGGTNSGTYSCTGVCSATVPANPSYYGNSCTSAGNACGLTNSGTKDCSNICVDAYGTTIAAPALSSCNCSLGSSVITLGSSVSAYSSPTVDAPAVCSSITQTRTCNSTGSGSTLSGTYAYDSCVVKSGSITSLPTCTIQAGDATCQSTLSWTSANLSIPYIANSSSSSVHVLNGASGSGAVPVHHSGSTYLLKDSTGTTYGSIAQSATCNALTSTWNGSTCAAPSGSITASSLTCTVPVGGSTCTVSLSWTTTLPIGGTEVTSNRPSNNTHIAYGNNSVTPQPVTVSHEYPNTTYYLYNNLSELKTVTITPSCASGSSWHPTHKKCYTNVSIGTLSADFNVSPSSVYVGESATTSWNAVSGGGPITCLIKKNGVLWIPSVDPTGGTQPTGSVSADTNYTLTCSNGAGPDDSKMVSLLVISGILDDTTPVSCEIRLGESSCTVKATWSTQHATDPKLVDENLPTPTEKSTLPNQSAPGLDVWIGYPQTDFSLKNGARVLDTKRVSVTLPPNTGWDPIAGKVVSLPAITLSPLDQWISNATSAKITWSATNATACNSVGSNWTSTPANDISGMSRTNIFNTTTEERIDMKCTGPAGDTTTSGVTSAVVHICGSDTPVRKGGVCADRPLIQEFQVIDNFTTNAKLKITCKNATQYKLFKDGALIGLFTPSSWPVYYSIVTGSEGSYQAYCVEKGDDGTILDSLPSSVYPVSRKPPTPIVSLKATPSTINANAASVISWEILYPNPIQSPARSNFCKLSAEAICTTGACTSGNAEALAINTKINDSSTLTDVNDAVGQIKISPDALNRIVSGGARLLSGDISSPPGDWKAIGKKTFILKNSMTFKLDCQGGTVNESRSVRVMVTSSQEG